MAREIGQFLQLLFSGIEKSGRLDLEAIEAATRAAMHRTGAAILQELLRAPCSFPQEVTCPCGHRAHYQEMRSKQLLTVVGRVEIERPYYICPHCHQGQHPRDGELDVKGTECSPGVRRMMALVGSETSFAQGREQLHVLAGLEVPAKAVERHAEAIGSDIAAREKIDRERALQLELPQVADPPIPALYIEMDGTGVPVVAAETEGRTSRREGQPASTREVKLGCVFTQTRRDRKGRPVRDEASTTYTGAIESAEEFGRRLYAEAWRRGISRARKKVVIGDGASWVWNQAELHFPDAIQIVDLYHAREHLWELSAKLFAGNEAKRKRWAGRLQKKLDHGGIESLVVMLRSTPAPTAEVAELLRSESDYFERNRERMRYPAFRKQGLFIGSGVIEAGCKTVIAARLKRSGMFWTVRGANAIIALRANLLSRRFEDYWESRVA